MRPASLAAGRDGRNHAVNAATGDGGGSATDAANVAGDGQQANAAALLTALHPMMTTMTRLEARVEAMETTRAVPTAPRVAALQPRSTGTAIRQAATAPMVQQSAPAGSPLAQPAPVPVLAPASVPVPAAVRGGSTATNDGLASGVGDGSRRAVSGLW
ncbi:hypothetical protein PC129_g21205 [Phytophthora cactorum]|uniref:Uncharacterized protein n=1 Tax=Phytophthora cactorum TaxID=29920 RepID=A0A8T1F474_9STRA|nr:hypothetical protein Pcac1_g5205 [Phytophthora cactorum]KAG2796487.1 hypothetical protein PC111_g21702 [Phytophthora cactorum]KAG2819805.1 hypothetical protein PC112_g12047 [Phytophthora cactorum]KAG2855447.1 hypothetical protein PC113_g12427 [Phytophthora cactorum]KAG2875722.1 hypothetical protein PC114_g24567 [Phytophthora cactorum]